MLPCEAEDASKDGSFGTPPWGLFGVVDEIFAKNRTQKKKSIINQLGGIRRKKNKNVAPGGANDHPAMAPEERHKGTSRANTQPLIAESSGFFEISPKGPRNPEHRD